MRYYIILFTLLLSNMLYAQSIVLNPDEDIIIYPSDTSDVVFCVLPHKQLYNTDYSWYARILCVEESRFKINVSLDYSITWLTDPIIGWVEKSQCGVYLRANRYEGRIPIMDLYETPLFDGNYHAINVDEIDSEWIRVIDIHIDPNDDVKYKVEFYMDGILHSGWVKRCCPDVYNSCT